MKLLLAGSLLVCSLGWCSAQSASDFSPSPYLDTITPGIYHLINGRYKTEVTNLPSKYRTQVKDNYKKMFELTINQFNTDRMMMKSDLTDYLSSIVERVALANGLSPKDINIFAYRSETPNAACYGNGVLAMMIGLLARLETEDQVAMIVCHELAHLVSKDNLRGIQNDVALMNDKNTRRSLGAAQKSEYNRYTKTASILDQLDMGFRRHSRQHESAADSLGLVMYLKAGYDPGSVLKAFEILRQADQDPYETLDFPKFLSDNGINAEPAWLEYTNADRWHKDRRIPDSLSTHPDITERTIGLSRHLEKLGYTTETLNESKELNNNVYRTRAQFEIVDAEFHFKAYGRALYHSIQLSKRYPKNAWLSAMTGRCLYEIYTRQKNHTLGKSLDQPYATYSDSYNKLLTFLHKLRLSEMENVTYSYMVSQPEPFYANEHFIYSLWLVSSFKVSKLDPDKLRDDYNGLFPNGNYSRMMKK